jgi:hypothetical protein
VCHAGDDAVEAGEWKPFFQNESGGEMQRAGTRHGDIVDGPVHGEAADITAGKE